MGRIAVKPRHVNGAGYGLVAIGCITVEGRRTTSTRESPADGTDAEQGGREGERSAEHQRYGATVPGSRRPNPSGLP